MGEEGFQVLGDGELKPQDVDFGEYSQQKDYFVRERETPVPSSDILVEEIERRTHKIIQEEMHAVFSEAFREAYGQIRMESGMPVKKRKPSLVNA